MRRCLLPCFLFLAFVSCGGSRAGSQPDSFSRRNVTLPNGAKISAEIKATPADRATGMMYRDRLDADKGMLFVHEVPGNYSYWMHNCRIPLDIVWLNPDKQIVEMSPETPPCQTEASQCPNYGGKQISQFVIELQSGSIARHGLKTGDRIAF